MDNLTLLLFGGIWKTLEVWTRKMAESCRQRLLGGSNRGPAQDVPEGNGNRA